MTIAQNILRIQAQIQEAVALAQTTNSQASSNVCLLAVSKTKPASIVAEAVEAGLTAFGENYVQEGVEKIQYFKAQNISLEWHFIGSLQSNKTRLVAENFDWCQTVGSAKIAQRLNDQRPVFAQPLNVLIQINISQEDSKSGIAPVKMLELAKLITTLPQLKLRGLMAIPAPNSPANIYQQMHKLYQSLQTNFPEEQIDTLSMGMTDDLELAIHHGSTMVRIGTAIFGAREY